MRAEIPPKAVIGQNLRLLTIVRNWAFPVVMAFHSRWYRRHFAEQLAGEQFWD
ncbi:hypothetical protein [uncultured Phyllobacterium sp.]|uniref:hypothetical protein n=1 Tax=uncultured Phyllobacterium sp. TaxID=253813 RepID=UPI002584B27D|nr:hypothetical protein [uncultured Phyllobacterium sp.]